MMKVKVKTRVFLSEVLLAGKEEKCPRSSIKAESRWGLPLFIALLISELMIKEKILCVDLSCTDGSDTII